MTAPAETMTVTELWRYPVKSIRGEQIETSAVGERGLHGDRMWAIHDRESGVLMTARKLPVLLSCHAQFASDPASHPAVPGHAPEVEISVPGGDWISSSDPRIHEELSAVVGQDVELRSLAPMSDKASYRGPFPDKAELRAFFGLGPDEPLPDMSIFPVRKLLELMRYATPLGTYHDAYAVHVLSQASLATMTEHAPESDFDRRRFRPTVLIDTGNATGHPEKGWCNADLDGPGLELRGEMPAIRCVMPTRAQDGLASDPEIMRTVAAEANRCLGLYASVSRPGTISVGDVFQVRRDAPPSAPVAAVRSGANAVKRGMSRVGNALLPKG